jgi:GAF domain-containing protein/anti-sigma regulatory factor (Ser/Thr protein kinase)
MTTALEIDKKSFFQPVVKPIRLALGLPVAIWLVDDKGKSLRIVAAEGLPDDYMGEVTLALNESSIGAKVFKTGQTIVVEDIALDEYWQYKAKANNLGLKSAMVVPLRAGQKMRGILDVYTYETRSFSDLEKKLIENLASQVVIGAIQSAQQFERVSSQADILDKIHQIGKHILSAELSTKGLEAALTQIAKSASSALGADLVDIYEYLDVKDLEMKDRYNLPPISCGERRDPKVVKEEIYEDDVIVKILDDGEPLYSREAQAEDLLTDSFTIPRPDRPETRFVVREGIQSSAAIPLRTAGETVGVMFINYRTHQDFTAEQQDFIELFANQAAMAIYNARIYAQAQKRIGALEALNEVGQKLSSMEATEQGLSDLLEEVAEQAKEILEADLVELYQYSPGGKLATHVRAGERLAAAGPKIERVQILPDDVVAKIIADPVPIFGSDAQGTFLLSEPFTSDRAGKPRDRFVVREQIASLSVLPLSVDGEPVGVLFINYRTPQRFTDEQQVLIRLFASQAAVAIRNARLFQQREVLQEIARDITSVLDSDKLLQKTLERSLELLNCEFGSISVYDSKTQSLHFRYAVGKSPDMYVVMGEGLIGTAAQSRKVVRVPNVNVLEGEQYVEHIAETQSELDVPMLVGDRLVGVLNAESSRLDAFSKEDQNLAKALAAQAALAFHTAELYEEAQATLEERVADIRALQDVYEAVGQEPLERILKLIVQQAVRLTPAQYGNLWILEQEQQELRFGVEVNLLESLPRISERIPLDGKSINSWVARTGQSYLAGDVFTDDHYQEIIKVVRSELAVPLRHGERTLGTLNVESTELSAFTEDHQRILEALAGQAAIAIDKARAYERLKALTEVGQIVTKTLDLGEVLEYVMHTSVETLAANRGTLRLLDKSTGELELRAHLGEIGDRATKNIKLGEGIVGWVAEHGSSQLVPDVREDGRYVESLRDTCCELTVPIKVGDRVIGVLNIEHSRPSAFDEHDLELLEAIADQAATAIRNARLYESVQAVNTIGQTLTSGIRLKEDEILELIYEQAKKLTGAQDMYIALYDEETNMIRFGLATEHGERVTYETREADMDERGRTEEVLFTQQPILHSTLEESKAWYGLPGHQEFIGRVQASYLGVPLIVGEKVLGMIALYDWERDHVYDEQDLGTFSSMASQAAVALDNATLYYDVNRKLERVNQQLQRRVEVLAALNEIGQKLTSGIRLEENQILGLIYEQAKKLTGTQDMYIALYDEATNMIRFGLATEHGERVTYESREADMEERGKTEAVLFTRQPVLHRTLEESRAWYYGQPGHKEFIGRVAPSWLGVPLIAGEKVLGMIALYDWESEYAYDRQDLQTFSSMANQAAIALENARLYSAAREEIIAAKQLATLGTAIAALQHRINNTFNIIAPNVTRLRKRVDLEDETIVEILDIIERNARYTSDIIKRIQEPLREVEMQDVDVNAVLNEVIDEIKDQWKPNLVVKRNLDNNIPLIRAPIGQVTEVFRNLSYNACYAMKGSGELSIDSSFKGGTINVRVQDTGPGIPARIQERLFKKPVPSKEPGGGAGLGLWLSQLILQTIGGKVEIEESDAGGTTMLVQIPTL